MKIAYFSRGLPRGTHAVYMDLAAQALRRAGNEVIACFPISDGSPAERAVKTGQVTQAAFRAAALRPHIPTLAWNAAQLLANRLAYGPLLKACRRHGAELIHESYLPFSTSGLRAARQLRVPFLLGVHELTHHVPRLISPPLRAFAKRVDRAMVLGSDGVMCISEVLRQQILGWGYPADRTLVLHNAVFPEIHEQAAARRDETRRKLGAEHAVVVGYLQGWDSVEPFDAISCMVQQSIAHISTQIPHAVFLLVGGGAMLETLRKRLIFGPPAPALRIVGQVPHPEVGAYLAAMDVAVCAQHASFTSPMKLFEYMASELPVVAPRQPNIEEILEENRTALLFTPGDAADLADCVVRLVRSPEVARHLGMEGKKVVLAKHTWDAYGRRLTEFAEKISALPRTSHRG